MKNILALIAGFVSLSLSASDIYVTKSGNDATGDGSQANPYLTICQSVTAANDAIDGGEASVTIHVGPGTYTESQVMDSENEVAYSFILIEKPISIIGDVSNPSSVVITRDTSIDARVFLIDHAQASLSGLTISGGKAMGGWGRQEEGIAGGNVFLKNGLVADCIIENGRATFGLGGAANILVYGGIVTRCLIRGGLAGGENQSTNFGTNIGGQQNCGGSAMVVKGGVVENCLITGNGNNGSGSGNFPVVMRGDGKLVNCTIAGNISNSANQYGGGGVYVWENTTAQVINCAIFNNTYSCIGRENAEAWGGRSSAFINCAARSGITYTDGEGCVYGDPRFTDAANGDYAPSSSASVLYNHGYDYSLTGATSTKDLNGQDRVLNDAVDIGCYEYLSSGSEPLDGSFSASVLSGTIPFTVTFESSASGGDGNYQYAWDFEDIGVFTVPTSETSVQHEYSSRGCFTVKLRITDTSSGEATVVQQNFITAWGTVYADSTAGAGGDGTIDAPYNCAADLFSNLDYANGIMAKGTFELDPTTTTELKHPDFVFCKWGNDESPNPMFESTGTASATATGVFNILAGGILVSNVNFRYTQELQAGGPLFMVSYNDASFVGCSFDLIGEATAYEHKSGVIRHHDRNFDRLLIRDCNFSDFNAGPNVTYKVLMIAGCRVEHCMFTNCATIMSPCDNTFTTDAYFVSNRVFDSVCIGNTPGNDNENHNIGAVAFVGNSGAYFASKIEISDNVLVNRGDSAGSVFGLSMFTYRRDNNPNSHSEHPLKVKDALLIRNNTVVGYDSLLYIGEPYCTNAHISVFNNLCVGNTKVLIDDSPGDFRMFVPPAAAFFCNNYRTAGADAFDVNYDLPGDFISIDDNIVTNAPIFKSVNSNNKNYYIPRKDDRAAWLFNAYTADGKYPGYIGAFEPMKPDGMEVHVR